MGKRAGGPEREDERSGEVAAERDRSRPAGWRKWAPVARRGASAGRVVPPVGEDWRREAGWAVKEGTAAMGAWAVGTWVWLRPAASLPPASLPPGGSLLPGWSLPASRGPGTSMGRLPTESAESARDRSPARGQDRMRTPGVRRRPTTSCPPAR